MPGPPPSDDPSRSQRQSQNPPKQAAAGDAPVRLAVLLSGGGRTLQNLADQIGRNLLSAQISIVVGSRPDAYGLTRATNLGLPTQVISRRGFDATEAFSDALFNAVRASRADLVCLAGFLSLLHIPRDYTGRVINIHPALLPSFGGQGMYGQRVHEAVLAAGCKVSGCTVHFCDNTYDTGPIIIQRACPVLEDDTPNTLAARVFEQERVAYPDAVRLIAAGRVTIDGRRTKITST